MRKTRRDKVLQALIAYERFARAHKSGGMLEHWRLAKAALDEYRRRLGNET